MITVGGDGGGVSAGSKRPRMLLQMITVQNRYEKGFENNQNVKFVLNL